LLYPAPADHPVVVRAAVDGVVAAVAEEPVVLCAAADAVVAGEQDRAGVEGVAAVHPRLQRRGGNGEAFRREDLAVRWDVGEVAIGTARSLGFPAGDHPAGVVIGRVRPMELGRIVEGGAVSRTASCVGIPFLVTKVMTRAGPRKEKM